MLDQSEKEKKRLEFLIAMYNQLMGDINRHIIVVWQSSGLLIGTFAVYTLVEKKFIGLEIATTLVVAACIWLMAHVFDSGYWYNRNLAIIANIERQFLNQTDLREIHYYFGAHRKDNKLLTHLRLQLFFGFGIAALALLYFFFNDTLPFIQICEWPNSVSSTFPYLAALAGTYLGCYLPKMYRAKYEEFLKTRLA